MSVADIGNNSNRRQVAAAVSDLQDRVDTLEGSGPVELEGRVEDLETSVDTATTGLLDRATALEARAEFLSGAVAPTTEGKNGDLYLDTATRAFYLKAAGTWGEVGTLTAPA